MASEVVTFRCKKSLMLTDFVTALSLFDSPSLLDLLVMHLSFPPLKFCAFVTGVLISP